MAEPDEKNDTYDEDEQEIVNLLNYFEDIEVPYLNPSSQTEQSVFAQSLKILCSVANCGDYREKLRKFTLSKEFSNVPFFKERLKSVDLLELPEWEREKAALNAALIHFSREYQIIVKVESEEDNTHLEFWTGGRRKCESRQFRTFEQLRKWVVRKGLNPFDKHTLVFNLSRSDSSKSVLCHAFLRLDFYIKHLFFKVEDSGSRGDENSNYRRYYLELFQFALDRLERIKQSASAEWVQDTTAIFLLGITGVGKSRILNLITNTSEFTVGDEALNSQTFFPSAFRQEDDQLFFDLPGIKDTRDPEISLLNSIILSSLYRSFRYSVSVLTLDYKAFKHSGRGNEIRDIRNFLHKFFMCKEGNTVEGVKSILIPEKLRKKILIAINRFDGDEEGLKRLRSRLNEIFGVDEDRMFAIPAHTGDDQETDQDQIQKLRGMIRKLTDERTPMEDDSSDQTQLEHETGFQVVLLDEFKGTVPEYSEYVLKKMLEETPDTIVRWHKVLKDLYSRCLYRKESWQMVEGKLIEKAVIDGLKIALDSRESAETKQKRLVDLENQRKELVKLKNQFAKDLKKKPGLRDKSHNTEKLKDFERRIKVFELEIQQVREQLDDIHEVKDGREKAEVWVNETMRSMKDMDEVMRYSGNKYSVLHVIAQHNFFSTMDEIENVVGVDQLEKLLYDDKTEGKQNPLHVAVSYGSHTVFKNFISIQEKISCDEDDFSKKFVSLLERKDSHQNTVLHLAAQGQTTTSSRDHKRDFLSSQI
eukprot:764849-Hanusia_phi.AAC.2